MSEGEKEESRDGGYVPMLALNCPRSRCSWVCGVVFPKARLSELRVTHSAHREEEWDSWPEEPVYMGVRHWVTHQVFMPDGQRLGHYERSAFDGQWRMIMEDELVMAVIAAPATESTGDSADHE